MVNIFHFICTFLTHSILVYIFNSSFIQIKLGPINYRKLSQSDLTNRGLAGGRPSGLGQFLQTPDPLRRRPKSSQIPRFPPVSQADFQNRELQRFLVEQNRIPNRFSSSSTDQRLNLLRRLLLGFRK